MCNKRRPLADDPLKGWVGEVVVDRARAPEYDHGMADQTALDERVRQIHGRYEALFAGQPRITRDPTILEQMLRDLDGVAGSGPAPELTELIEERRALYQGEIEAVRAAQAEGPDALEAHLLANWARLTYARYRRHFAGQSRTTRDLGLLSELVADLERLQVEIGDLWARYQSESLGQARNRVHESLLLYREERGAIAAARGAGTLGEQASILATVANAQFRLYSDHFAGKSRLSRRPARLERIVGTLTQTRDRMDALRQQGLHDPSNERNIGVVDGRLELYRKELEAVRSARQQTSMEALVRGLGEAANAAFDQYREHFAGQDRGTRDLQLLDSILEELHDMARQMDDLDRVRDDPANQRNLAIVLDQIRSYDREDQLIRDAKGP